MEFIKPIIVDIENGIPIKIKAKQNDIKSRFLLITIIGNNVPLNLTNHSVKFYADKPDNTKIFNNCTMIDATKGMIKVELTSQTLAKVGDVQCELVILGTNGDILSTTIFIISVEKGIRNDNAIESSNEFTAFTGEINRLSQKIVEAQAVEDRYIATPHIYVGTVAPATPQAGWFWYKIV